MKRKNKILSNIGLLLIITGLAIILWDYGSTYLEKKSIEKEMQDFFNAPVLTDDDDFNLPEEAKAKDLLQLEIEAIDINHPVIQSDNWDYLNRYLVAWPHSPKPPKAGNFSIAGHNGRCASCVFRNFDKLKIGDEIKLSDLDNTYVYEIQEIFEVEYTDISVLDDTPDSATITLVTCTKQITYDEYRTIVKGEMIDSYPRQ